MPYAGTRNGKPMDNVWSIHSKLFALLMAMVIFPLNALLAQAEDDVADQTIPEIAKSFEQGGYIIDQFFEGTAKKNKRHRVTLPDLVAGEVFSLVFMTATEDARITFTVTGPGNFKVRGGAGRPFGSFSFEVPRGGKYRLTVTMRKCETSSCGWAGFLAHPM